MPSMMRGDDGGGGTIIAIVLVVIVLSSSYPKVLAHYMGTYYAREERTHDEGALLREEYPPSCQLPSLTYRPKRSPCMQTVW